MKAQFTVIAAALFATSAAVSAANPYGDFAKGNPDLSGTNPAAARVVVSKSNMPNPIGVHGGLGPGNPDLVTTTGIGGNSDGIVGIQPGIGDSTAGYGRSGERNPGLFSGARVDQGSYRSSAKAPDIYHGFCTANPDLSC